MAPFFKLIIYLCSTKLITNVYCVYGTDYIQVYIFEKKNVLVKFLLAYS